MRRGDGGRGSTRYPVIMHEVMPPVTFFSKPSVFVELTREVQKLVLSLLVLKFFQGLRFNLPDSLPGDAHHLAHLFQREGAIITGNPRAVTEGVGLEPPIAGRVLALFNNKGVCFLASVQAGHRSHPFRPFGTIDNRVLQHE